jgi:hypothetical protein
MRFLVVMQRAAGQVYDEGMVSAGSGLSYGVTGNAYMQHTLYRKIKELYEGPGDVNTKEPYKFLTQ